MGDYFVEGAAGHGLSPKSSLSPRFLLVTSDD